MYLKKADDLESKRELLKLVPELFVFLKILINFQADFLPVLGNKWERRNLEKFSWWPLWRMKLFWKIVQLRNCSTGYSTASSSHPGGAEGSHVRESTPGGIE